MSLASGTKLGPYAVQSPLGAGGMGGVYRAKDPRLDRTVAVKILPSHLSDNPEAKPPFDREARAISSLNHPNVCALHEVGHQDGIDFLRENWLPCARVDCRRSTPASQMRADWGPAVAASRLPVSSELNLRCVA